MKGKTKTILTIVIAILVFAIAVVGTVTFLKDDGEASAAEGTSNTLPVAGLDDEQTSSDGEENPTEPLDGEENPEEQPGDSTDNTDNTEGTEGVEGTTGEQTTTGTTGTGTGTTGTGTTGTGTTGTGTTGTGTQGTTTGGQVELPTITTIEQERLVSTTLNWTNISLNSTIGRTGINYTNLGYTIKYYQVVSENETVEIGTETGTGRFGTTVTVTDEQISGKCPTGYKFEEEMSTTSTEITPNVNGNVIEVYYVKDYFDLKIEYTYEDGTPASDPYEEEVEFEGEYSVESPEIPGYTPSVDVVEGEMPDGGEEITVTYTPNTDVSYTVKYLEQGTENKLADEEVRTDKTFDATYEETAKTITGYTVVGEATQEITLDAYGKELVFYYTKNNYDLKIEYEYEDGTQASDPYEEEVEFEGKYSVESPEIPGYTPSVEVVEGEMPAEDETITVIYTPNTDVSYTVKYLEQGTEKELADEEVRTDKTFDATYEETAKTITGYTVVGEATQEITLDAYGKELTFYYTKNNYDLKIEYEYEDGTQASDPYEEEVEFEGKYSVESPEIPGYTPSVDVVEGEMPAEDETITVTYTPNTDVSYTVKYLEQGTGKVLATEELRTGKTFNETYTETAKTVTGYTVVGEATQEITLDEYNKVLTFYYTKNNYNYIVKYFYEGVDGVYREDDTYIPTPISAKFEDVITTFEPRTLNDNYVLNHVTPADEDGNAHLVISANKTENVLEVYYERNTFEYKVVYYKNSVSTENKLGETKPKEEKVKTVMTPELVAADFGTDWLNAYKPTVGYQEGVASYITIQANNNNVINVVYNPRNDIPYTVEYYYNGELDNTGKNYSGVATFGGTVDTVTDYSNNGEWTVDTTKSTALPFEIVAVSGNIIKVYYVKPVITVEKTRTVNTNRTTGAQDTVEPGETITYTITATNNGYKEGTVKIGDVVPRGTTLTEGTTIVATGYDTVTEAELAAGIDLTVPAKDANGNPGTASVTFTVTVLAKPGEDVVNTPDVNGEKDENNTVTNQVEKTIQVKAKTQSVKNSNIVIVLDTSISMDYQTTEASNTICTGHRIGNHYSNGCIYQDGIWYKPATRMEVAKKVVNDFIDNMNLPATSTTNSCAVTVVEFNGDASVVGTASTSSQAITLKGNVTNLSTDYYTNMADGLELAKTELVKLATARPNNANIVIFVSDGEPTKRQGDIPTAASDLKSATLSDGTKLNPTVYTVAFGSDIAILKNTIASDSSKYYTTETSGSLSDIFSSMNDDITPFIQEQSVDGLVELEGIYADEKHEIVITVNGEAQDSITQLPTDESGNVILRNGKYYLDLSKFAAGDTVTIEYYSNN